MALSYRLQGAVSPSVRPHTCVTLRPSVVLRARRLPSAPPICSSSRSDAVIEEAGPCHLPTQQPSSFSPPKWTPASWAHHPGGRSLSSKLTAGGTSALAAVAGVGGIMGESRMAVGAPCTGPVSHAPTIAWLTGQHAPECNAPCAHNRLNIDSVWECQPMCGALPYLSCDAGLFRLARIPPRPAGQMSPSCPPPYLNQAPLPLSSPLRLVRRERTRGPRRHLPPPPSLT